MYMTWIDWTIVALFLAVVFAIINFVKKYVVGVSDFLAGSRLAGRYLLTVAGEMGTVGAISVIAMWESSYFSGWGATWWKVLASPFFILMVLSGWVIYRYRQTRALTVAQFLEQRYSRRFRIAAGLIAFIAGALNYAIFPSVAARFIMYVCGIPDIFVSLGGLHLSLSYAAIMAVLLGTALWITLKGGQIGIMLSDGIQGVMMLVLLLVLTGYLMHTVSWDQIGVALQSAPNPETASMVNPFKTSQTRDFNIWFYAITVFGAFYGKMAWQGNSGYNAAAKSPHEARMAGVLGVLRGNVLMLIIGFIGMAVYALMHHPDFAGIAALARERIGVIMNPAVQKQMTVPVALGVALPVGLLGSLVAIVISMAVTTDDTYLHSWGSIFIQDVIMPFRKTPLSQKAHMKVLRGAIVGVALFAYFFSLFFRQTDYLFMFMAITGSVFIAGAGACIVGGLYWKRGTTAGAWAALITGSVLSVSAILLQQQPFTKIPVAIVAPDAVRVLVNRELAVRDGEQWVYPLSIWRREDWRAVQVDVTDAGGAVSSAAAYLAYGQKLPLVSAPEAMPNNQIKILPESGSLVPVADSTASRLYYRIRRFTGQQLWFFSMLSALLVYVTVSLAGRKVYNLDQLLHRGAYQTDDVKDKKPVRGWRALFGVTSEFTKNDKRIYFGVMVWTYGWVVINMIMIAVNLIRVRSDGFWIGYFKYQLYAFLILGVITAVWYGTGAVKDAIELCRKLASTSRDETDDGRVEHKNEP